MNDRIGQIKQLRDEGLTYQAIGDKLNLSRERVYQILHPDKQSAYERTYRKTDKRKAYQRAYRNAYQKHYYHLKANRKFNNCEKCSL